MWTLPCLVWYFYRSVCMWWKSSGDITPALSTITPCRSWAPGRSCAIWGLPLGSCLDYHHLLDQHFLRVVCHRSVSIIQKMGSSGLLSSGDTELRTVQLVSPMVGLLSVFKMLCVLWLSKRRYEKAVISTLIGLQNPFLREHLTRPVFIWKPFGK